MAFSAAGPTASVELSGMRYYQNFEDALSVEQMGRLGLDGILIYDRDFDRVPDTDRQEP